MEKVILSRKELYDLVWSTPLTTLGKKYNISDVGLRKICKKHNIPLPKQGYWQKKKLSKRIKILLLPSEYQGDGKVSLELRDKNSTQKSVNKNPIISRANDIKKDSSLPLKVPGRLSRAHPLVNSASKSLILDPMKDYRYEGFLSTRSGELDIKVSTNNVRRSLRFMNALIKLLQARGHSLAVHMRKTYAIVKGDKIQVDLREKSKIKKTITKYGRTRHSYYPSGILSFRMVETYHTKEIMDTKEKIEEKLALILAELEIEAEKRIRQKIKREEYRKEEERKAKIVQMKKERIQREIEKTKSLLHQVLRWEKAKYLREFINEFTINAEKEGNLTENKKMWIKWANKKADWIDPLIKRDDEILGEYEKNPNLIIS